MLVVFVVDTEKRPLAPCHSARARRLLAEGKAAVWRRAPFTIILKRTVPAAQPLPLRIKVDPGSKVTGLAPVNDATGRVAWAAELTHRAQRVHDALLARRAIRHGRRRRLAHYRPARFDKRRRPSGWLPPSLESRISNVLTWVAHLRRYAPVATISQELVRFDGQLLENPDITGMDSQQGELAGYEVREYLLEKWRRACVYCGAQNVPLQIEHIIPRARGGSNRVSNLTLACVACHQAQGTQTAAEFWHPEVQAQARQPLKDAAVNASRWALYQRPKLIGLPVEAGTGGQTKWNRAQRGLPKADWIEAACVGASTPERINCAGVAPLRITAMGRECRQMCRMDRYAFPRTGATGARRVYGFQTGDMVRAVVPASSVKAGVYVGRLAVRATGKCTITTSASTVQGIHFRYCRLLHHANGYMYQKGGAALPRPA
ncbi:MAG TPA: RNA-guided endonuclease IscB [Ktedonobacterales bacterium]|nr:RNA-guided endonuclease IscB [Ktedonobacterales bacterium]